MRPVGGLVKGGSALLVGSLEKTVRRGVAFSFQPGALQGVRELSEELPGHPGIVSYSSLELPDGNWGNLIVLDPPEAGEHWRTSAKHAWAASELAPRHYTVVRLHNGRFPGGLRSGHDPVVTRTRYYDFQDAVPWRAERAGPR